MWAQVDLEPLAQPWGCCVALGLGRSKGRQDSAGVSGDHGHPRQALIVVASGTCWPPSVSAPAGLLVQSRSTALASMLPSTPAPVPGQPSQSLGACSLALGSLRSLAAHRGPPRASGHHPLPGHPCVATLCRLPLVVCSHFGTPCCFVRGHIAAFRCEMHTQKG